MGLVAKYITFEDIKFDMSRFRSAEFRLLRIPRRQSNYRQSFPALLSLPGRITAHRTAGRALVFQRKALRRQQRPIDYVIEDCDFHDNAEHGMIFIAATNSFVRRCRFWGNGFKDITGGHGFSARALYESAPSGWTNTSRDYLATYSDCAYNGRLITFALMLPPIPS